MNTLKEKYNKDAKKFFQDKFSDLNVMAIPKIAKVVINCGIGKMAKEKDAMEEIFKSIKEITGQSPVYAKAKKSISGFKSREGQEVGIVVTLRGERMWSFLERLIGSALPRIRDFRGIDVNNFDNRGNLNLAIREQIVFPEISPENVKTIYGFQITIVTTAKSKDEGIDLLRTLGFPIKIDE
jgi:large subunit ribosomal protein L5